MAILHLLLLIISFMLSNLIVFATRNMVLKEGLLQKNYMGKAIPNALGIAFVFNLVLVLTLFKFFLKDYYMVILTGCIFIANLGLIDDVLNKNSEHIKGFTGHFTQLIRGNVTTGLVKAFFGFVISIYVSIDISSNFVGFVINVLLITLSTNFINLLDLRPGRAVKAFMLIGSTIFIVNILKNIPNFYLTIMLGTMIAYYGYDVEARAMMGDTGSNLLGFITGVSIVLLYNFYVALISLAILIYVHIIAEKDSLSNYIRNNKILNFIDCLDRKQIKKRKK